MKIPLNPMKTHENPIKSTISSSEKKRHNNISISPSVSEVLQSNLARSVGEKGVKSASYSWY
jgi:hypothetical protein